MGTHMTQMNDKPKDVSTSHLKRSLSLPLVVLYGLGVTIGAGIYVLVGATAGIAGALAPVSFVAASIVMLPSALSFAELVGRFPVSAGEAAYVRHGLNSQTASLIVGLMVVLVGTVSAATISVGSVGYLREFIELPGPILILIVVGGMTLVAAWGVQESVGLAAAMAIVEIGGLIVVLCGGFAVSTSSIDWSIYSKSALLDPSVVFAVLSGGVLAFFAFIGFEDLVNMAEETKEPSITMPQAILLTLAISTLIYVLVAFVAISAVPIEELSTSQAPLSLVFRQSTGASPAVISAIAVVATLNGVIVQIIMASRVIYGLSSQSYLPSALGHVNPMTRTPVIATLIVGLSVFVLAIFVPMRGLAEATSHVTLIIFTLVNVSLLAIKYRGDPPPEDVFVVRWWVPLLGVLSSSLFLVVGIL